MEAFAALPISAEHFYTGGPKYADGVHEVPTLPLGRPVMLQGPAALSRATKDGFSFDGPWTIAAQGLALAPGQFGEIAGQIDRDSADRIVLRLEFASPVETLELLINDAPAPDIAPSCGTFAVWEGPIQAGVLSGSVAFRVHLRSAQPVVLHAMELSLAEPASARPVPSGAVAALARRTRQPWGLAEDRLCVADSPLVVRGAQRLAVFLPDEPDAVAALQPFLQALRAVVRPDAHVTLVGARRLHGPLPGFTFFPADWSRLRRDGAYLRQRSQAFQRLDAQVIVNALHPRLLEVDLLLVEHRACLVVGFEAEGFSATPAEVALIRATYSSLISGAADVGEALMRHFALPSSPV